MPRVERTVPRRGETPRQRSARPERVGTQIGFGGAKVVAGIIQDEHVGELKGLAGIQTATKMRRSNAQVRCVQSVISLPIRSTVWMVEEPDDASAAEREAAVLLRENLFGGMESSWDDLLREACLAVYYGYRVPEIVWEERAGVVAVRKIGSRNPELVERWLYDPEGALVGYLYVGNRPKGQGLTADAASGMTEYVRVAVPLEKTVHFCYDQENENPAGFGLWRSMYQHWYIVQALYKVLSIGVERNLLDVPVGKLGPGAQADDRGKLLNILKRWRAAEDAAVVLTEGQEIDFVGPQRSLMDGMPFLQHHDAKILQAGLAQFLNLGQTGAGTQALGTVLVKLFETSEDGIARWIGQTLTTQLSRRWTDLNYPGGDVRPPVIRHKPIKSNDLAAWSTALTAMLNGGLLHPTPDDEEFLRDTLELPAIPREQLDKAWAAREAADQERRKVELARLQGAAAGAAPAKPDGLAEANDPDSGQQFAELESRTAETPEERAARVAAFKAQFAETVRSRRRAAELSSEGDDAGHSD